jgi:drug/metabolite transporter (DMT)-like permease
VKGVSIKIILSYLAVYVIWGSTYFFIKMSVESIPPFYVVGLRFLFGGVAFLALSIASGALRAIPTGREIVSALFLGVFLLLLGNGFVSIAEKSVDSYLAALVVASTPFCVALFNGLFFREKPHPARLLGMLLGLAGVALLLYNGTNVLSSFTPGVGFVIAGLFCWSFATSVGHRIQVHKNTLVNSGLQMLFAGVIALAVSWPLYGPFFRVLPHATGHSRIGLAYLTVLGALGFYCYSYLIKHEPSIRVVSYAIVNPLIAVCLGLALGHEKPAHFLAIGFPLILTGLALMLYGGKFWEAIENFRGVP